MKSLSFFFGLLLILLGLGIQGCGQQNPSETSAATEPAHLTSDKSGATLPAPQDQIVTAPVTVGPSNPVLVLAGKVSY